MKPIGLHDLRDLVRSESLQRWYTRYAELQAEVANARERRDDLLAQSSLLGFKADQTQHIADELLFRAGECEELAAGASSECAQIENTSFEVLSAFERQRTRASVTWGELGRYEARIEEARAKASEVRARLDAARRMATREAEAEAQRLRVRLQVLELLTAQLGSELADREKVLSAEEQRKDQLWTEEEATWSAAFRALLARAEYDYQARRVRARAEKLFGQTNEERQRVEKLAGEAEAQGQRIAQLQTEIAQHLQRGRREFECVLIEEFLYWPREDDGQTAFCVPLVAETQHFNVQVAPMQIYEVERNRGLAFISPVPEDADRNDDDPRLAVFFGKGPEAAVAEPELEVSIDALVSTDEG
jgi:hypothetical protein